MESCKPWFNKNDYITEKTILQSLKCKVLCIPPSHVNGGRGGGAEEVSRFSLSGIFNIDSIL